MSIFHCGHCGRLDKEHIRKVVLAGYSNMLCFSCGCKFDDAVTDIARRYLQNTVSPKKGKLPTPHHPTNKCQK